jgi:GntR family transcriptional regulator
VNSQPAAGAIAASLRREWTLLPAGTRLPSDRQVAECHAVGRGVVAGAMACLEREGLVRRERGAGTYWLGQGEAQSASQIPSFTAWLRGTGAEPGFRIVRQESRRVVTLERDYLRLPANSLVWKIQRVFTLDGIPIGFATSVLPYHELRALPSEVESYGSLYQALRRRYRVDVVRHWTRRRPVEAPASVGQTLGLRGATPFRLQESLNRTADGTPVEYSRTFVRCDGLSPEALTGASVPSTRRQQKVAHR